MTLFITLVRGALDSGTTSGGIQIGTNTVYSFPSTSAYRRYELKWAAAAKRWLAASYSIGSYGNFVFNSSGNSSYSGLPNDAFLPETHDPE